MNISANQRPSKTRNANQSNQISLKRNLPMIALLMGITVAAYAMFAWTEKKTEAVQQNPHKSPSTSQQAKESQETIQQKEKASQEKPRSVIEMTGPLLTAYQKFSHLLNSDITDKNGNVYTIKNIIIRSFKEYTYG
jgi:hypothetical protein